MQKGEEQMKHEKTFEAISKLKDIEAELHRLKNALEMANKALDGKREWVGLTYEDVYQMVEENKPPQLNTLFDMVEWMAGVIEAKLKEKNA
jgi:hypothetical protein